MRFALKTVMAAITLLGTLVCAVFLAWIMLLICNLDKLDLHVDLPKGDVVEVAKVVEAKVECRNVWESIPHPEFCSPGDRLGKECMIATKKLIKKECK